MRVRLLASIGGLTSAILFTTVAVVGQTPRPLKPSKSRVPPRRGSDSPLVTRPTPSAAKSIR